MGLFKKAKRYTWIDAFGTLFVNYEEAEIRRGGLQKRYPERKFRVHGHSLCGYHVQVRAEVR